MTSKKFFEIACERNYISLRAEMTFAKFAANMGFYKNAREYGNKYQMEVFKLAILAGKVPGASKKTADEVDKYLRLYNEVFYPCD